jgi:hypothetical protein
MKKFKILITIGAVLLSMSCKDALKTVPKQSISAEGALSTLSGVQGLLINVYNQLQQSGYYGRDIIIQSEVLSDNCRITVSNSGRFVNEYSNVFRTHFANYTISYDMINKSNLVIDNVAAVGDASPAQKNNILGQALFLRALVYFNLVNEYGYNPQHILDSKDAGVALVLKGVSALSQVTYPARAKVTDVYAQIELDLTTAISLLDNTNAKTLVTKAAAQALRSRVALYNGEWQTSIDMATAAINANVGTFVSTPTVAGYSSIFNTKNSPESIFELNFEVSESLVFNSIQSIYQRLGNSPTSATGYGDVVPQNNLLNAYEAGDIRKTAMLVPVTKSGEPVFWVQKYSGWGGSFGVDNIRIIRVSEMYLNRAEAYAHLTQDGLAQGDVNKIRVRAGLIPTGATGAALLAVILNERRIELAYEGHRWFDLVRQGANIVKDNNTILFTDIRILAPIPQADLDVNPQLTQNNGYK